MQNLLIALILLTCYTHSQTVVAKSDTTDTISGTAVTTLTSNYAANFLPGAVAIWNSQGNSSPVGTTLIFNKMIYLSCAGPLTLSIAAFGNYQVWWDGANIFNGNNYGSIATTSPSTKCGSHNLTIVVTKTSPKLSGLIYSLSQDQSNCFNCNSNGFWNQNTCSCQCLQGNLCGCPTIPGSKSLKVWSDYPTCACTCPLRIILPTLSLAPAAAIVAGDVNLDLAAFGRCGLNQYYSQVSCNCRCNIQYCPYRQYYNDDPAILGGCGCRDQLY